jgi:hypothetical protein
MPVAPRKKFQRKIFLNFPLAAAALVFFASISIFAQAVPDDTDLYYRRTHQGQWPPPGVNPADHSGETTNVIAAATNAVATTLRPRVVLDNDVNPTNLGKGDWIWQMPQTETRLGVATVQAVIDYEKNLGMQWITVKCGNGGSIWTQFDADLIARAHAAGLKIFGWAYAYGNNSAHYGSTNSGNGTGEINVALNALALGADGFIIDGEIEYETNATRRADATLYASTIKSNYPTRFLAHAPFPYINSHAGFPYLEFGTNCDAVMPQDYWGAIGISPQTLVANMNSKWITWQNSLTGFNTNAIKPIIPLGQSYAPVTGAEITAFLAALQTNTPKACASGYNGVSFWDAQSRNADMDAALNAAGIGSFSNPPAISSAPSSRWADQDGTIKMSIAASGSAPLAYRWRLNGTNVPGATTNIFTLANIQTDNAGNYTVVITNAFGSVTSSVAVLTVNPRFMAVFSDNFDINSSANWTLNQSSADTRLTFPFDYSVSGIPSAPNSTGGTTIGVKFEANLSLGVTAALNISPVGQSFAGNYRLHFDMWINANGPFPLGGTGSTEHFTAGLGTAGNRVQWNSGSADGAWFATDGEGQATDTSATLPDWRAYLGTTLQTTNSGVYSGGTEANVRGNGHPYYANVFPGGQTAPATQQSGFAQQTGALDVGTVGFAWRDVVINKSGSTVEWFIDGLKIAAISNVTFTASNIFIGYWDSFAWVSDNTNLSFGLVDNVRVEVPAVAPVITANPLSQTVKLGTNALFTASATGLPAPNYQWRFNGTNIFSATNASYALAFVAATNTGNYSVVATNIAGSATSSNALLALLPPSAAQFQSVSVTGGLLQISFTGDAHWIYTIETSTNLTSWSALTNLTSANGAFNFTCGITNAPQQFFRARVGP